MPDSNVELVRRGLDAVSSGDLEAVIRLLSDDVEIQSDVELPNSGEFHGHDGFLEWLTAWLDAWESFRVELREATAIGDAVVASVRQFGTGRGSGVDVEMDIAYLFRFRDGAIVRVELYADSERALGAARAGA
jgi:ketosteroid isomerase-like protein